MRVILLCFMVAMAYAAPVTTDESAFCGSKKGTEEDGIYFFAHWDVAMCHTYVMCSADYARGWVMPSPAGTIFKDHTFMRSTAACVDDVDDEPETAVDGNCNTFDMVSMNSPMYMALRGSAALSTDGKALFSGELSSFLTIPYYSNNELGDHIRMSIKFQASEDNFDQTFATLVTNNQIDVSVTINSIRATINTEEGETCIIEQSFPASIQITPIERTVDMTYDGSKMSLSVGGIELDTQDCSGRVVKSGFPMIVGRGFNGVIDELKICKS